MTPIFCRECLLEVDEGIVTVCEVVDEIVKRASDVIYAKYLEDAAYGYAVQDAKENILRSIAVSAPCFTASL